MNQVIPDAAVEAAARCHYEAELGVNWDGVRPSVKRGYLDDARRMLEAAAPHMHRAAWNEGFTAARAMQEFRDTL